MGKKTVPSQICIVTVIGVDQVGIIAKLASTMARANVNIVDVNQRIMEKYFVMTMAVDIVAANTGIPALKKRLDRVAKDLQLTITIQDEHLFEVMHRV